MPSIFYLFGIYCLNQLSLEKDDLPHQELILCGMVHLNVLQIQEVRDTYLLPQTIVIMFFKWWHTLRRRVWSMLWGEELPLIPGAAFESNPTPGPLTSCTWLPVLLLLTYHQLQAILISCSLNQKDVCFKQIALHLKAGILYPDIVMIPFSSLKQRCIKGPTVIIVDTRKPMQI
jgi:hypothetical protein